jgi:hypothetical protein
MEITAIALLRASSLLGPSSGPGLRSLDDAVLFDTGASFALEPAALGRIVHARLGASFAPEHGDPRGIFFLPHVAAPQARSYEGVVAEVGEGGVWGPLRAVAPQPMAADAFGPLLGNLLQQMPSSLFDAVGEVARAQPDAFERAGAQLRAVVGKGGSSGELPDQLAALENAAASGQLDVARLGAMLEGSGIDVDALNKLVGQVGAALAKDPEATAALAEKLFGGQGQDEEDDE